MTEQEVNDFMHRFLDDDLSEDEAELLLEHLRQSPASEAMFNRLVQLNDDLQQLPKVTPPVSIVDSIIPQLEREGLWDRPIVAEDEEDRSGNVFALGAGTARSRMRGALKWFSGVAVAGIALTVFVTTFMNGDNTNHSADDSALFNAEQSLSGSSSSSNANQVTITSAQDSGTDAEMPAEEPGEAIAEEDDTAFSFDASAIFPDSNRSSSSFTADVPPAKDEAKSMEMRIAESPSSNAKDKAVADQPQTQQLEKAAGPEETAESTQSADPVAPAEPAGLDEAGAADADAAEPEWQMNDQMGLAIAGDEPRTMTIAEIEASNPNAYGSPDQSLVATVTAVEGGHQIVVSDLSGAEQYRSRTYLGEVVSLVWFSDSKRLMLEMSSDGATRQVMIDVANRSDSGLTE